MNSVYVNGIGVSVGKYTDIKDVLDRYLIKDTLKIPNEMITISELPKHTLIRKMDRFSKLFLQSSIISLRDAQIPNNEHVGTIFNSVFGPMATNLDFASYINTNDLENASPKVFVNTVNNACVGYAAMILGCKGVSTMFLMSDHIGFGLDQVRKDGDTLLLTSGDEYLKSISLAFESKKLKIREISSSLVLSRTPNLRAYSQLVDYKESFLGYHPFFNSYDKQHVENKLEFLLNDMLNKNKLKLEDIDCIICTSSFFRSFENELLESLSYQGQILSFDFECLSSASSLGVSIASHAIKHQGKNNCLVTNLNYSGGYNLYLLSSLTK